MKPSPLRQVRLLLPVWTVREVRAQYRQSALDLGWSLLTPVITVAGFGLILSNVFGVEGEGAPYVTFAWAGVVVWTFVATALVRGASSMVWSAELIRKMAFPKVVVPLAAVLATGLDLVIGAVVLGGLMVVQRVDVDITVLGVVPTLAVLLIWTCAGAVLFATLTAFVRDVAHGLAVVLRVGIFVTPVMYPSSQVPARYHVWLDLNPIAVCIEAVRSSLFLGHWPGWTLLGVHAVVGSILLGLSLWYLQRVEGRIADVV